MIKSFFGNLELILHLSKRDILQRYKGTLLGIFWSVFQPLIMLLVYTFVFHTVFKARWGDTENSKGEFAVILFCGLIVFNVFAETLNRAPGLILNQPSYVKKVVFPLEVLPWISLVGSLFNAATSFLVLILIFFTLSYTLQWTIIFLPLLFIPYTLFIMGITWILSSLGVFMRDIGQFISIATTVLLFMTPVFYPLSSVPPKMQIVLQLNPLTFFIEEARRVVLWGQYPDWLSLAIYLSFSLLTAWLGFYWFQKTRKGFADVV